MELLKGQTYITAYGAILDINEIIHGWHGRVKYTSSHVLKPHPASIGFMDLYIFEQMIRDRTIFLDTPANRILYGRF